MLMCGRAAAAAWMVLGIGAALRAQPPEVVPAGTRVIQPPLSGRAGVPGSVAATQTAQPGGSAGVNTINSVIQVQGAYQGSVPSAAAPGAPLPISLDEALKRGLQYNLGPVGFQQLIRQAQGMEQTQRANLLPQISGGLTVNDQQTDLAALGFSSIKSPAASAFPTVIGPFHYFDFRAGLSQSIFDVTRLKNYRASQENVKASQFAAQDARDLVVLAVAGAYLQTIAVAARIESARAQVATAQAAFQQASDRFAAGTAPRIDAMRSQVELQSQQQRLTSVENDFAKIKIAFGRLIGLPGGQEFTLTDALPFAPLAGLTLEQALTRAYANRADLKAAAAQVHAAELAHQGAMAERLPTVEVSGDYGLIGTSPMHSHGTFAVSGAVRFPIWQGGRVKGDVQQADAALEQRRAEYQDLRGRVDADVRSALLDLTAAASQVTVSQSNRDLAGQTLVQAQEAVAAAEQDYIASLYAHNLSKAALARAMGQADQGIKEFLSRP